MKKLDIAKEIVKKSSISNKAKAIERLAQCAKQRLEDCLMHINNGRLEADYVIFVLTGMINLYSHNNKK